MDAATEHGIKVIASLDDEDLLKAARGDAAMVEYVKVQMIIVHPGDVNPYWIIGRAAEKAYDKGLIDEVEFDYLTRY